MEFFIGLREGGLNINKFLIFLDSSLLAAAGDFFHGQN